MVWTTGATDGSAYGVHVYVEMISIYHFFLPPKPPLSTVSFHLCKILLAPSLLSHPTGGGMEAVTRFFFLA